MQKDVASGARGKGDWGFLPWAGREGEATPESASHPHGPADRSISSGSSISISEADLASALGVIECLREI